MEYKKIISFTLVILIAASSNSYQDPIPTPSGKFGLKNSPTTAIPNSNQDQILIPSATLGLRNGPKNIYHIQKADIYISDNVKKSKSYLDAKTSTLNPDMNRGKKNAKWI